MSLATLTVSGRGAIALAIKERRLHLAWGTGDAAWDETDAENIPSLLDRTALEAEVGRRAITAAHFVTPDSEGTIEVPEAVSGSAEFYSITSEPTPYLYIKCDFDYDDAPDEIIREVGIFMDTVAVEGTPEGQKYLLPSEVDDPGILLSMQILKPRILRSASVRQTMEFILPI